MKANKTLSGIKARNYSVTFGYFTKYVELPNWIFEKYQNDSELANVCIDYINNITCNVISTDEKFELCIK
jgi:predicted Ser/Thr protein kinase